MDALYDPTYSNIVSAQRIQSYTLQVNGNQAKVIIKGKDMLQMTRDDQGALWIKPEEKKVSKVATQDDIRAMHERYGHISYSTLKLLPEYPKSYTGENPRCEACEKGKATKPPAPRQPIIRTQRPLGRLHADVVGPIEPVTPGTQFRYLLVVTDDFSRYMITKPLRKKSDAADALIEIINALEKATSLTVKAIQADWGGKFRNKDLREELSQRGITSKETLPGHNETNAVAKRANRTILVMSQTALIAAKLPRGFWDRASNWAAYTKNRVPHKTLKGRTPIETLLGKDPVQERLNLRPFGQPVICFNYKVAASDKLAPRSYEARIIGYTSTFGKYWTIDKTGKQRLAKDPKPTQQATTVPEDSWEESSEGGFTSNPNPAESPLGSQPPALQKKRRTTEK